MKLFLGRADYLRYRPCPTATHHGWAGAQSRLEEDTFLLHLQGEGRIVRRLARRLFGDMRCIGEEDTRRAHAEAIRLLSSGDCTLRGARILYEGLVAQPDFLMLRERKLYLFHTSAKVGDLAAHLKGKMLINCFGDVRAAYRELVHGPTTKIGF